MPGYLRPTALDDALAALSSRRLTVLAGGTDFYPARVGAPLDDDVLDITALAALRGIEERDDHWRIPGACDLDRHRPMRTCPPGSMA